MTHPRILTGDALETLRTLPAESVHCVVTSPPYYGLRDYGVAGQIGLEPTPEAYVLRLLKVFREVRRVLRGDGTVWLNLGDCYAHLSRRSDHAALKSKDLIGIPWRMALALQADGWFLRSDIIWSKPNAVPESVKDRPTRSHEYVFLLSKSGRYFYDQAAVREPVGAATAARYRYAFGGGKNQALAQSERHRTRIIGLRLAPPGRNRRTVWNVPTRGLKEAHFAVMPEAIVEPCLLAGTPEAGCCPECGAPWTRVLAPRPKFIREPYSGKWASADPRHQAARLIAHVKAARSAGLTGTHDNPFPDPVTTGWRPSCGCAGGEPIPATVLDPFAGAGTVLAVATRLGRSAIGIELNPAYAAIAERRLMAQQLAAAA
jgi:DNA modification methylase